MTVPEAEVLHVSGQHLFDLYSSPYTLHYTLPSPYMSHSVYRPHNYDNNLVLMVPGLCKVLRNNSTENVCRVLDHHSFLRELGSFISYTFQVLLTVSEDPSPYLRRVSERKSLKDKTNLNHEI